MAVKRRKKRLPTTVPDEVAWEKMLNPDAPIPEGAERPEPPRALGLNRLVKSYISLQPGRPRSHAVHPSSLHDLCPMLFWLYEKSMEDLTSQDPETVQAAYDYMRKAIDTKERSFSPAVKMEFKVGSTIHTEVQYRLGVIGKLWGRWRCGQCRSEAPEGWMPRVWGADINGERVVKPAPCVKCKGVNLREDVPWVYIEPHLKSKEWGISGHADGDLRIKHDGWWHRYVLEIKSRNRAGWEGKRGPLPVPQHVAQASIYAWLMGVDYIYLVYVCKDQVSRWKEFTVPVDREAIETAKEKISAIMKARDTGEAPVAARVCGNVQDARARSCPGAERCFGAKPTASWWDE